MTRPTFFLLFAVPLLVAGGCISARITPPHQPYSALLDHEGQLDIAARVGAMEQTESTAAVQVAYSPVESFEVAVSADADFHADEENRTQHLGGGLAVGGYTPTDVLRLEGLLGVNGGMAQGDGFDGSTACTTSSCPPIRFDLRAPYVMPFGQLLVGFEVPYFELAAGVRVFGMIMDVTAESDAGSVERSTYARAFVEQVITIRVPIEIVRIEVTAGLPLAIATSGAPIQGAWEHWSFAHVSLGLGFQLDTVAAPTADTEGLYTAP